MPYAIYLSLRKQAKYQMWIDNFIKSIYNCQEIRSA